MASSSSDRRCASEEVRRAAVASSPAQPASSASSSAPRRYCTKRKRRAGMSSSDMVSEIQVSSASGLNERLRWDETRLAYLTKMLLEHHRVGKRASTSWKPEAWEAMRSEFNNRFGLNVTTKQLKVRVQVMKNDCAVIKNILNASGFGFNSVLNTFVATDEVWDAYIQKHPEARAWRRVTIPLYNEWYEIFEGTKADGTRQQNTLPRTETSEAADPCMTPPHETTSLAEAILEATQEFKKASMPSSYKMIQECVELIMTMNLTISDKAKAADLIRRDNAFLIFLKFDDATRLEWLKLHLGDN